MQSLEVIAFNISRRADKSEADPIKPATNGALAHLSPQLPATEVDHKNREHYRRISMGTSLSSMSKMPLLSLQLSSLAGENLCERA